MNGFGILSLLIYIAIILVMNMVFKRKIAESMGVALLVLLVISGKNAPANLSAGVTFALKQEVLFVAMAFVFMSYLMGKTGIIQRMIAILNSFLGRLAGGPGYVTTIASALFGMVSGSPSGNVSAVGTITLPWMKNTGWSKKDATTVAAGNAGVGVIFPPSNSMFLLLGMSAIAAEVTSGQLYIALFSAGAWVLLARLLLIPYFVRKDGIKPIPKDQIPDFGEAFSQGWRSLLIFLGAVLPVFLTTGPLANLLKGVESFGANGVKSLSIIFWIPVLISLITILEGWKYLPHTVKGWVELCRDAIGSYSDIGALLLFFSNEGCIPHNSAPIYIASGIAGLENPAETFRPLVLLYALPTILLGILMCLGILPIIH